MTKAALRIAFFGTAAAILSACGGPRVIMSGGPLQTPPRAIVTTSNNPTMADSLVSAAKSLGYSILDTHQTSDLISALTGHPTSQGGLNAFQEEDVLAGLKARKVDAILTVNVKTVADMWGNQFIDVFTLALYGTAGLGGSQTGLDWHNSWGGMPGSPADHMMREHLDKASADAARALAGLLGAPGAPVSVDMELSSEQAERRRHRRHHDDDAAAEAAPAAAAGAAATVTTAVAADAASSAPASPASAAASSEAAEPDPPAKGVEVTPAQAAAELLP